MIVACHQPNYMPWPGYFGKASRCDTFVLLDSVQFPRGASFVNRNRIKVPSGKSLWLTVPVKKKGRGLQSIGEILINNETNWRRKHELSLIHAYSRAPYFRDHFEFLVEIYSKDWVRLLDLNRTIVEYIAQRIGLETQFKLCSEVGAEGKGTDLLVQICKNLGGDTYLSGSAARKYLNEQKFSDSGISLSYFYYYHRAYPQLWGDFIPNLSVLDLLFNCGERALRALLDLRSG